MQTGPGSCPRLRPSCWPRLQKLSACQRPERCDSAVVQTLRRACRGEGCPGPRLAPGDGRDAYPDVDRLHTQPVVFVPVASDPTVSWLVKAVAAHAPALLAAINTARARICFRAWDATDAGSPAHVASAEGTHRSSTLQVAIASITASIGSRRVGIDAYADDPGSSSP